MNAEDADAIHFMEIASHLGYLGYTVTPPTAGATWYTASHASRWRFGFTRWSGFLWLRCVVTLPEVYSADCARSLALVNQLRINARVASYYLANDEENSLVEATAFLPAAYDRTAFGDWILLWIEETSRISNAFFCDSAMEKHTS